MPRYAMPIGQLLALSIAVLVATPGSSLASESSTLRHVQAQQPADGGNIRTQATGCGKGSGAGSNAHSQQCVEVAASGFLADEQVLVRELRRPGWRVTVRADSSGQVRYRLTPLATHSPKPDVLTFVGLGPSSPAGTSGTVQVSVPRIAVYRFGGF